MTATRMGYLAAASMRACVSRLIRQHYGPRKSSVLYQVPKMTATRMGYLAAASMRACVSRLIRPHHRAGQKLCFVSGAENDRDQDGLPRRREHESLREQGFCLRRQHHGPRKSSVLYQGTTLVGP